MEKIVSEKITIMSLISMIMVIYIHSYNINSIDGVLSFQLENIFSIFNIFLQNLIVNGIARVAIPIFFIISGYLFFNQFSMKSYTQKVLKRFHTLFIPYLFWSFLTVFIYFVLQSIPEVQHFFKNTLIVNYTLPELFNITWINPRNFPLWFLRDLMLLVLLSPIIYYFVINYLKLYFIIILILWFIIQPPTVFSYYKPEPLFFFSVGAYLSLLNKEILLVKINNKKYILLFIIYILLLLIKTVIMTFFAINNELIIIILQKFSILVGIIVFWFLLDRYLINNRYLWFLSKFTFIYYVFHEPGLKILQEGFYGIIGETPILSITLFIVLPLFMILFLTLLGIIMKKYIPKITSIVTGNRL